MAKTRIELLEENLELRDKLQELQKAAARWGELAQGYCDTIGALQLDRDEQVAQGKRECAALREELTEARSRARNADADAVAARKEAAAVLQENDRLRDRLHGMTIENARLEGYRERVEQFDPVSDKQAHYENVRPLREASPVRHDFAAAAPHAGETWYRRRA